MHLKQKIIVGGAITASVLTAGASLAWAATRTVALTPGNGIAVQCTKGSLAGSLVNNQWNGTCNATTTIPITTTTGPTTTVGPTTTIPIYNDYKSWDWWICRLRAGR